MAEWIFSQPQDSIGMDLDASSNSDPSTSDQALPGEEEDKALQSQNDLHSEEASMGMTKGDRINNFESEVNKANAVKCFISRIKFDSSETKDNLSEVLQSLECVDKTDPPQKQEDISGKERCQWIEH